MKIERLISMIMILLERTSVSAPELARTFEVSVRTIYRDLDALNRAGIPIVSRPGLNGGVGIMDSYKLEKRLFTTADVTTLLMGLGSMRSSISGEEVINALAKVKGLIPEEQREEIELRAGRIHIDMTSWLGAPFGKEGLQLVQRALERGQALRFAYCDRHLRRTRRCIEPCRLVLKESAWYVQGWCRERRDFRLFKLSRMAELELADPLCEPRTPPPVGKGDFSQDVPVLLRVGESALDRLLDIFGPDCLSPDGDRWLARIHVPDDARGCRFLLGLGPECQCLEPERMRQAMKEALQAMLRLYEG